MQSVSEHQFCCVCEKCCNEESELVSEMDTQIDVVESDAGEWCGEPPAVELRTEGVPTVAADYAQAYSDATEKRDECEESRREAKRLWLQALGESETLCPWTGFLVAKGYEAVGRTTFYTYRRSDAVSRPYTKTCDQGEDDGRPATVRVTPYDGGAVSNGHAR